MGAFNIVGNPSVYFLLEPATVLLRVCFFHFIHRRMLKKTIRAGGVVASLAMSMDDSVFPVKDTPSLERVASMFPASSAKGEGIEAFIETTKHERTAEKGKLAVVYDGQPVTAIRAIKYGIISSWLLLVGGYLGVCKCFGLRCICNKG